jgi:hypothetical protein
MVVRLRLQRFGRHDRPFYRIVAADSRAKRDGRFIERVRRVAGGGKENGSLLMPELGGERRHRPPLCLGVSYSSALSLAIAVGGAEAADWPHASSLRHTLTLLPPSLPSSFTTAGFLRPHRQQRRRQGSTIAQRPAQVLACRRCSTLRSGGLVNVEV